MVGGEYARWISKTTIVEPQSSKKESMESYLRHIRGSWKNFISILVPCEYQEKN